MRLRRMMTAPVATLILVSPVWSLSAEAAELPVAVQTHQVAEIDRAASCSWFMRLLGLCERHP